MQQMKHPHRSEDTAPDISTVSGRVFLASQDVLNLDPQNPQNYRSPEEIAKLKKMIALITRVFANQTDIDLVPSPNGGWSCALSKDAERALGDYMSGKVDSLDHFPDEMFRPDRIFYDLEDLRNAPEPVVLGVTRHEIGHAKHSDYRLFVKGQRLAKDEGHLPTTWAMTHNALEDPWINNLEVKDSAVVKQQMDALYNDKLPEIVEKVNSQPLNHQLNLNIIHYWHTGKNIPTLKNEEVLRVFEEIKPHVEDYFSGENAQSNFDTLRQHIWNKTKVLSSTAVNDEMLKEAARRIATEWPDKDQSSLPPANEGAPPQQSTDTVKEQKPEETSDSLERGHEQQSETKEDESALGKTIKKVKEFLRKIFGWKKKNKQTEDPDYQDTRGSEQSTTQQQPRPPRPTPEMPSPPTAEQIERDDQIRQALDAQVDDDIREQIKNEVEQQLASQEGAKGSGELPEDIDLTQFVPETLEKIKEAIEELPQDVKEKLAEKGRELLDEKNAESLKRTGSRSMSPKKNEETGEYEVLPESQPLKEDAEAAKAQRDEVAAEEKENLEREAQEKQHHALQKQRYLEQELERNRIEQEMERLGFDEREFTLYREFKALENSMQGQVEQFKRDIERALPMAETFTYEGSHYSGPRLNRNDLARKIPSGRHDIFHRKKVTRSKDPRLFIELIIDYSGSMQGAKMTNSIKSAIFLSRVLKDYNIPFGITFFAERERPVKGFSQDYDSPQHKIFPRVLSFRDAQGGGTNMGDPLIASYKRMSEARRRYPKSQGAIWIISDSGANQGLTGAALSEQVQEIQKTFPVSNFLLSGENREIDEAVDIFGKNNVIATSKFHELPQEAAKVLTEAFRRVIRRR